MSYFSAILEPFGLREAASLESKYYMERVQRFIGGIREVLKGNDDTEVFFSIHLCFFVDTDCSRLLNVLSDLRRECFREGRVVPFTAIVTKGKAEFIGLTNLFENDNHKGVWRDSKISRGEYCNAIAADLFGRLTKLKAIAISIDDSVMNELKDVGSRFLLSHYITDYSQARLKPFRDVLFRSEDIKKADVRTNILREFRETSIRSRKLGRFFIPLLVNWCHASILKPNPPPLGPSLTQYAAKNWLGAVNEGVGLEMLYCALLERLASQDKDLTIEGSSTLLKALAQQRWLRESTRSNNNSARFAHELISESAKRWFAIKLSEMEATKRGPKSHK